MPKPTFFFVNFSGDFLAIASRVLEEGYDALSWYSSEAKKGKGATGKGLIPLVDNLWDVLDKFYEKKEQLIVIIDDNGFGSMACTLQKMGYKVIGTSEFADSVEHQRELGNKLAKRIGLSIPPTYTFEDFSSGKGFLMSMKAKYGEVRFVFKADGIDLAGSSKTYVSRGIEDLIWFMDWVEKDQKVHNYQVEKYELQLVIEGTEVDFACWFDGEKFANNLTICFEQKKIHDLGAAQGCMGQLLTFVPAKGNRFFEDHLSKLLPILKAESPGGFANEWAINTIISHKDQKPYFLEFTPRFGWDSTLGELSLLVDAGRKISDFFLHLAFKKPFPKGYFSTGRYSAAIRLFSDSHGTKADEVSGKPITWSKEIKEHIWPYAIRKREDGRLELTDNPFGVATRVAESPAGALNDLYSMVNPRVGLLTVPDIFYSEHIGENVSSSLEYLQKEGWI